ncbi:MAG TPA: hypothetical protein PLH66_09865, partial [Syntrophales bacterium]|nr:hypothetical protein [Syntrophales bacterium]
VKNCSYTNAPFYFVNAKGAVFLPFFRFMAFGCRPPGRRRPLARHARRVPQDLLSKARSRQIPVEQMLHTLQKGLGVPTFF